MALFLGFGILISLINAGILADAAAARTIEAVDCSQQEVYKAIETGIYSGVKDKYFWITGFTFNDGKADFNLKVKSICAAWRIPK